MSKGLGQVQRFVLDELSSSRRGWLEVGVLAYRRYGSDPTTAQLESLRRAIRTLAARELVETRRFHHSRGVALEVRRRRA